MADHSSGNSARYHYHNNYPTIWPHDFGLKKVSLLNEINLQRYYFIKDGNTDEEAIKKEAIKAFNRLHRDEIKLGFFALLSVGKALALKVLKYASPFCIIFGGLILGLSIAASIMATVATSGLIIGGCALLGGIAVAYMTHKDRHVQEVQNFGTKLKAFQEFEQSKDIQAKIIVRSQRSEQYCGIIASKLLSHLEADKELNFASHSFSFLSGRLSKTQCHKTIEAAFKYFVLESKYDFDYLLFEQHSSKKLDKFVSLVMNKLSETEEVIKDNKITSSKKLYNALLEIIPSIDLKQLNSSQNQSELPIQLVKEQLNNEPSKTVPTKATGLRDSLSKEKQQSNHNESWVNRFRHYLHCPANNNKESHQKQKSQSR